MKRATNADHIRHRWIAAHILPHEGEVRGWLRRHAHSLSGHDVDDLIQEAYARLWLVEFSTIGNGRSYFYAIVRNLLLEHVRRARIVTEAGKEAFPRHYSWFAQLLIEAMAKEHGLTGLRTRLGRIASAVVAQLRQRMPGVGSRRQKVEQLSALMDELGYDARTTKDVGGVPTIEADNCIFHELAMKSPEICHFDLALLSGFTDSKVDLHECMARGGHVCRFRFTPR